MIRTAAGLALALLVCADARAQIIVQPLTPGQPQGVISPPSLPFVGAPGVPSPVTPPRPLPLPAAAAVNPFFGLGYGFAPYGPIWYEVPPPVGPSAIPIPLPIRNEVTVVNNVVPQAPPDVRARLTINGPEGAQVFLAGEPVDSAVTPVVLESPALAAGQRYSFDVRVVWREGRDERERRRTVTVEAGESKSLTYTAANGR